MLGQIPTLSSLSVLGGPAAAQVSWEKERKYHPVMPVLAVGDPDEIAV